MRIVLYEMKKIWRLKLLLAVAVICGLFYFMFMGFGIEHFPNGHPETEEIDYGIQMIERYGVTLEDNEFSDFVQSNREELLSQTEAYIKNNPIFSDVGIYTYADYQKINEKPINTEAENKALWTLAGEKCDFVQFKLQTLNNFEAMYQNYPEYTLKDYISKASGKKELDRFMEIQETGEYRNIMSGAVYDNTVTYTVYLAVLAILTVLVLVSPLIVTDRARNMHFLQYTSKHGRRIFCQQFSAVMLSAFLLTTVLVSVFGAVYSVNGTWVFWNSGLTSFLNETFRINLTYGQYIAVYVVLLYVLCLGAAAAAFVLSRFSQNLISLILKLIPEFAVLGILSVSVFNGTFQVLNILYVKTKASWIEPVVCGLVLAAGLVVSFCIVRREKKIDVI